MSAPRAFIMTPAGRWEIVALPDPDGRIRWYSAGTGFDTEVSGTDLEDAIRALQVAWGDPKWELEVRA